MKEVKKDHSIGEGTGAVAGAVSGAAIGSAAGPVGTVVGAVVGGVAGAKAGGAIAEAVNPTEYTTHFKNNYQTTSYYNRDRTWDDYSPAYDYGYKTYGQYQGQKFDFAPRRKTRLAGRPTASRQMPYASSAST